MTDDIWKKIKYWQKKYTWPVSALIGIEYKNETKKKKRR